MQLPTKKALRGFVSNNIPQGLPETWRVTEPPSSATPSTWGTALPSRR